MYSALFGIQCTCALPTTSAVSDNNVSKDPRPPSIPPSICTTLKPSSPDIYCTVCSPPQLSLSDNNFRKCPLCTIFFVSSTSLKLLIVTFFSIASWENKSNWVRWAEFLFDIISFSEDVVGLELLSIIRCKSVLNSNSWKSSVSVCLFDDHGWIVCSLLFWFHVRLVGLFDRNIGFWSPKCESFTGLSVTFPWASTFAIDRCVQPSRPRSSSSSLTSGLQLDQR